MKTATSLQDAIRENLSPEAVALMAAFLRTATPGNDSKESLRASWQVEWFADQLVEMLGRDSYNELCEWMGL